MDFKKGNMSLKRLLFILPALLIYLVFMVYPMVRSLIISLHKWDGLSPEMDFIGIKNYIDFFKDPVSYTVLKNNLLLMIVLLIVPVILGLVLAVALNKKLPGRIVYRTIYYSPYVLPMVAVGLIWSWIYDPMFGALNSILKSVGLGQYVQGWLGQPSTAFPAILVTIIWRSVGMPMLLFLAGLQDISPQLYESAEIDGANKFQQFIYITIPQLKQSFAIVISLLIVGSLKQAFGIVYAMTWGGPGRSTQILSVWMYFNTFLYEKAGYGSAIAWIMTIIAMLIIIPYIRIMTKNT
jgi:raffinose/stachyose/melibiose transport system permease protein